MLLLEDCSSSDMNSCVFRSPDLGILCLNRAAVIV